MVNGVSQVVTVFVAHEGRVLLVRRSGSVGSYRGMWAGVSGYVERLPLDQARLEMAEEAGLEPQDIRLRGIGVPMPVEDAANDSRWLVFPFLFETDRPDRVRTDWEAAESRWVEPPEVPGLSTVPGLADALARVWPPFGGGAFWAGLEAIATDTERGATDLALAGLGVIADHVEPENLSRAVLALAACRPSMGVFPNIAVKLLSAAESGVDYRAAAASLASELVEATETSATRAAERLRGTRRILTLSRSRAVYEAVLAWARETERAEVVAAESRPKLEGVGLAAELARSGTTRVTLITDAQMGHFVPLCDAVLVGCDAITPSGDIVNKVGTRLAVMSARDAGIPAFAVAQTFKIVPPGWPDVVEEQDPADVHRGNGLRARNVIFDRTPIDWFAVVVTERGDLKAGLLSEARPPDVSRWMTGR